MNSCEELSQQCNCLVETSEIALMAILKGSNYATLLTCIIFCRYCTHSKKQKTWSIKSCFSITKKQWWVLHYQFNFIFIFLGKYFEWVGYFGASIAKHKVFLYLENQVSVYISDFDGHLICKDNNSEKKPKGPI